MKGTTKAPIKQPKLMMVTKRNPNPHAAMMVKKLKKNVLVSIHYILSKLLTDVQIHS